MRAVAYCHSQNILHRDIKAENVLVDKQSNVKLIDMGLAEKVDLTTGEIIDFPCGTPGYIAPELVTNSSAKGKKVVFTGKADVWSVGVLAYAVCGYPPFYAEETSEVLKLTKAEALSTIMTLGDAYPKNAKI